VAVIQRMYYRSSSAGGRRPFPLEAMLRIHVQQQWFTVSDPLMEEMLIDTPCFRFFAEIKTMEGLIPDETTILAFRHLMEKHDFGQQIFEVVKAHLNARAT